MAVIQPDNHPEFPHSVHTLQAESLFTLISTDVNLIAYFDQIKEVESQSIRELGAKKTPSLWLYLLDDAEEPLLSGMADVVTTISLLIVDSAGRWNRPRQNLYRRILAYIQILIHKEVCLRDDVGNEITSTTIQFNKIEAAEIEESDTFVIELQCVFGATIVQQTQLPE